MYLWYTLDPYVPCTILKCISKTVFLTQYFEKHLIFNINPDIGSWLTSTTMFIVKLDLQKNIDLCYKSFHCYLKQRIKLNKKHRHNPRFFLHTLKKKYQT